MCVIAFSPAGVDIPSRDDIEKMFKKNAHGAGMAITRPDGFTEWHKGYMDLDSFMEKLDEFSDDLLKQCPTTLHFRITTKGNTDPETCHPFPLSPQFSDMRKLHGITQGPVVFHNGTISGFGGIGAEVSSDSQDFVMGPLFYIMKGLKPGRNIGALRKTSIEQLIGTSRLLMMMPDQDVHRFGTGWTQHTDKVYYSNMLWRPSPTTVYNYNYGARPTTPQIPASTSTAKQDPVKPAVVREADEWGCHSYPGVWPGEGKEWIEFNSVEVMNIALRYMTNILRGEETIYKHKESGMEYKIAGDRTIVTEKGEKLMADCYMDELDEIEEMSKEGQITFETLNDLSEFVEALQENKDGTYKYGEDDWYADYDALALYTKDFLMAYFQDNIEGVTNSLLTQGYIEDKYLVEEDTDSLKLDLEDEDKMTNEEKLKAVANRMETAKATA